MPETQKWLGRPSQPLWHKDEHGEYVREDGVTAKEDKRQCAKCGVVHAGDGNILCGECKARIEAECL